MPNWCDNKLTLSGDRKSLEMFRKKFLTDDGGQVKFLDNIKKCRKKIDPNNWCVENWGTKWDINLQDTTLEGDGNDALLTINFLSAWNPPDEALKVLSTHKNLPSGINEIELQYYESGMDFGGQMLWMRQQMNEGQLVLVNNSEEPSNEMKKRSCGC